MASPLDFTLEGLTPEQQQALRNYRGGAAAAAQPGGVSEFGRPPGAPISNRAGPGRPSAEARALASQQAPAAPKAPQPASATATQAARAATAPKLSVGQRAVRFAKASTSMNPLKNPLARGGALALGGGALVGGAFDTAGRTQEEMAARQADLTTRQLGLDPNNLPGRVVRGALDTAQSGFERLIGMFGVGGTAPATTAPAPAPTGAPAAPAPAPARPTDGLESPTVTALAPGSREARVASQFLDSRAVPAYGRGVLRNDQTGEVTTFNAPAQGAAAGLLAPAAAPTRPVERAAPVLGTEGGIFGNLLQFQKEFGQTAMQGAQDTRAYKRAQAGLAADLEQQKLSDTQAKNALDAALRVAGLGIQQQTADAATATAAARARGQVEVIPGLPGEPPMLVNKATGRASNALVVPTFEEFSARMREDSRNSGLTDEQMIAAYQEQFGQQ